MICRHMCISMTRTRIRHLTEASLTISCSRLWGAYFVSKTPRVWEWPWPRMASSNWRSVMANPRTCGEISKAEWKSKLSSKIFHSLLRNAMIPSFFLRVSPQCRVPLTFEKRWKAPHPCREPSMPPFSSRLFRCPRFRVILEEPEGGAKFDESTDGGAGDWFFGKTNSDQHQRNINILSFFLLCYFWIITYYNIL